jgi:hypothetical protein
LAESILDFCDTQLTNNKDSKMRKAASRMVLFFMIGAPGNAAQSEDELTARMFIGLSDRSMPVLMFRKYIIF